MTQKFTLPRLKRTDNIGGTCYGNDIQDIFNAEIIHTFWSVYDHLLEKLMS